MARMHGGRRPNEKAKDFKGIMKKLIRYMAIYKVQVFFVAVFAICGTIFNIVVIRSISATRLSRVS